MRTDERLGARVAVAVAIAALCAGLVACGSGGGEDAGSSAAERPQRIFAFVFAPRGFNDVTRAWFNGFDRAAAQLGGDVTIEQKAPGALEVDAGAYLSFIRSALVQKPDGIVVVPNNAAAMAAGLRKIAAEGTKVLVMDQDVHAFPQKVAFVGTDNVVAGQTAARWMLDQAEGGRLRSKTVAVLASTPGTSSTDDRLSGFEAALRGSDLKIVAKRAPGCGDAGTARSTAADVLSANPELGGLFSVCDLIATGAAQALRSARRLDVQHVSVDASTQGVKLIRADGAIDAEIAQHLLKVGQTSVTTLAQALRGERVPRSVDTGSELITAANAGAYLRTAAAESKG